MSQFKKMKPQVGKWTNIVNREFTKEEAKCPKNT